LGIKNNPGLRLQSRRSRESSCEDGGVRKVINAEEVITVYQVAISFLGGSPFAGRSVKLETG
jgi:hypothetical protein